MYNSHLLSLPLPRIKEIGPRGLLPRLLGSKYSFSSANRGALAWVWKTKREVEAIVPQAMMVAADTQALVTCGPALTGQTLELWAGMKAAAVS